jgi:type I protein arginine methyltransferase
MAATHIDLDRPHRGAPADVIPLQYHAQLLLDEHRMNSFRAAIAEVVRAGMHVLDLGAGTGVLSYFAAQQGASVTAVERDLGVFRAARAALADAVGDQVRVVHADARTYLPDEPVDVVLCEMMHVGQLRERQVEVIRSFKQRYRARFGNHVPRFIPEACVQAVQPVHQDFTFHGYAVAAPLFQDAFAVAPRTTELAGPRVFQHFCYADPLPDACTADAEFTTIRPGHLNAIRIITKNLLAIRLVPPASVDWLMNHLIVPLRTPVFADARCRVRVRFEYQPGDEITALMDSAEVTALPG